MATPRRKAVSPLGVLSLLVGAAALALCWVNVPGVPREIEGYGTFGRTPTVMGLGGAVVGLLALLVSTLRGASGRSLPFLAILVNVAAVAVSQEWPQRLRERFARPPTTTDQPPPASAKAARKG